jgi:hypothetical protein
MLQRQRFTVLRMRTLSSTFDLHRLNSARYLTKRYKMTGREEDKTLQNDRVGKWGAPLKSAVAVAALHRRLEGGELGAA